MRNCSPRSTGAFEFVGRKRALPRMGQFRLVFDGYDGLKSHVCVYGYDSEFRVREGRFVVGYGPEKPVHSEGVMRQGTIAGFDCIRTKKKDFGGVHRKGVGGTEYLSPCFRGGTVPKQPTSDYTVHLDGNDICLK